jgi:SET domain-containing protein
MRYTNHSCKPNAQLVIRNGRVEFYALRDISPGDEITVDYGETHHDGKLPCRCGAPGCRGAL